MEKENFKDSPKQEDESLCKACHEEPVFMNGLCVFCYEDEFYGKDDFEDKHKDSKMTIHGQSLKDPHQQELSSRRTAEKVSKIKKKK
jgi:hypothetical protein